MENTPKRGRGRPAKPVEETLEQRSVRFSRKHWAKIDEGGMPWLRDLVEKGKLPPKQPPDEKLPD